MKTFKALIFPIIILNLFIARNLSGKVSGQCYNCHTMHNSQNNSAIISPTQNYLLKKLVLVVIPGQTPPETKHLTYTRLQLPIMERTHLPEEIFIG